MRPTLHPHIDGGALRAAALMKGAGEKTRQGPTHHSLSSLVGGVDVSFPT